MSKFKRFIPLLIIVLGLAVFFALDGQKYVSLTTVKEHYQQIQNLVEGHFGLSILAFVVCYIVVVALAIPAAAPILTILGSSIFGWFEGTFWVVISATIGSCIIFLAVKYAMGKKPQNTQISRFEQFRQGFQNNAFGYLMTLRLIPLFPFFAINLACGALGISLRVFFWATLIGIIPGTAVYAWVGSGLGYAIEQGKDLDMSIVSEPQFILPIICLAILSLVPNIYKKIKGQR